MAETAAQLVQSLEREMTEEFEILKTTPSQFSFKNYLVYKHALSRITEHSTVFKPMLTNISTAYDTEISSLNDKISKMDHVRDEELQISQADETIRTLTARTKQLKANLSTLDAENCTLTESIESMKELVADISAQSLQVEEDVFKNTVLDNMTLEQMTNINLLSRELGRVEQAHLAMLEQQPSEYVLRERFQEARVLLLQKEEMKEARQEDILQLYRTNPALKHLIDILSNSEGLLYNEIESNVQKAMLSVTSTTKSEVVDFSYDDEDLAKEKEAEVALAYVEYMEELLRDGNFQEAAIHAANSPNGFLRTLATIEEFKSLSYEEEEGVSPYFVFCSVLMETVPLYTLPPEDQSYECVCAALKEDRLDLIAQWIANQYLTLNTPIAEVLLTNCQCRSRCDCESGTLALAVFRKIKDHEMSMHCLARQGAFYRAVHYAKCHELGGEKLLKLLKDIPSTDLAALLVLEEDLTLGEVLRCLKENHNDNIFINLLKVLDESNDLKSALMGDTTPEATPWVEFIEMCIQLGENDIAEELQGFVLCSEALRGAVHSLSNDE